MAKRKTFQEKIDESFGEKTEEEVQGDDKKCGNLRQLQSLVNFRLKIQKDRIRFGNQLYAKSGVESEEEESEEPERFKPEVITDAETIAILEKYYLVFLTMELELDRDIKRAVESEEIYEYLKPIKGLGPILSAKLISMIDPARANTASALWRYAGFGVTIGEDGIGRAERPVKGVKLPYNAKLKSTMFLVVSSFLKCNSPYRAIYDAAKARYQRDRPDWVKDRIHKASMRKTAQVFLAHLHEVWRKLEGLPVRPLYVHEYMGHTHVHKASDFGWTVPEERKQEEPVQWIHHAQSASIAKNQSP